MAFLVNPYSVDTKPNPLDLNPGFYWETTDKPLGTLNSFLDETGTYTATGTPSISIIEDLGVNVASMNSTNYYSIPTGIESILTAAHTIVLCMRPNLAIPPFNTHLGAFVNAGPSEHQYSIQVNSSGLLQCFIKVAGSQALGRTELVGLGSTDYSIVTIRVSQTNGIRIRVNGINRVLEVGAGDGDLSAITLANLSLGIPLFWGARNGDGTPGSYATATYCSLIGYPTELTDEQITTNIENFYA